MTDSVFHVPYCGGPPVPGYLTWNTDPVLAIVLIGCAALYWLGVRKSPVSAGQFTCFWTGWALTGLALMSPLCNLGVALFSARIAQHVVLTTIAAPLLMLGRAERIGAGVLWPPLRLVQSSNARLRTGAFPVVGFAAVMWAWHAPALYDATFQSTLVYWTMHASMIGAALVLWYAVFRSAISMVWILSGMILTMLQMSLLGALLTLAPRPLFAVHSATTWPWGLSQLQDQQLGGLIMWVIGGFLITGCAAIVLMEYLSRGQAHITPDASDFTTPSFRPTANYAG
jgi:putative membrane protein